MLPNPKRSSEELANPQDFKVKKEKPNESSLEMSSFLVGNID
jgi:hypothetical protein